MTKTTVDVDASRIDRREFLWLCGATAAILGLGEGWVPKIAEALEKAAVQRPSVMWLNFASDTGCTEALIKANYPNIAQLILETLSLDYHETIMAAAGVQSEEILAQALKKGGYILIIEGAVPTKKGYGMIARRDMIDIGKEFSAKAKAVIAVGSCATWGGVPAGNPNPAGLKGVRDALGVDCINLDLCPVNEAILVATIVDFLLTGKVPERDRFGRPKIFYGQTIHDQCERRAHFEAGRFVERFGSKEEELGYCLYKMGCKGPMTYANCSKVRYNDRVSWCIGAGGPCIGCAEHGWVDKFAGFYERLPGVAVPGIEGVEAGADKIGLVAGAATAAGIAAHAIATAAKGRFKGEPPERGVKKE
ncbi:MAG: hydrogenase small subunit [Nitrospirae bacterium]|nr:hydrogenase small subunit [Nitrospirota bacterium]